MENFTADLLSYFPETFTAQVRRYLNFKSQRPRIYLMGRQKKKFSNLAENGTNRLDDIKSGANLPSDYFFDFLKNHVSWPGCPSGPISPRDLDLVPGNVTSHCACRINVFFL